MTPQRGQTGPCGHNTVSRYSRAVNSLIPPLAIRCSPAVNFAAKSKTNHFKSNSYDPFCYRFAVLAAKGRTGPRSTYLASHGSRPEDDRRNRRGSAAVATATGGKSHEADVVPSDAVYRAAG